MNKKYLLTDNLQNFISIGSQLKKKSQKNPQTTEIQRTGRVLFLTVCFPYHFVHIDFGFALAELD